MANQFPIWTDVTACNYQSNKSFGSKNTSERKIYVGSSKSNSELLATVIVTKRIENEEVIFRISVDGKILKEARFQENNNRAGKFIKIKSILKRIKGL